jgi:hypothetical protein
VDTSEVEGTVRPMAPQSEYGSAGRTAGLAMWLVRLTLVGASGAALWGAQRLAVDLQRTSFRGRYDPGSYARSIGLFVVAGLVFGIAVRIPFPRPRISWGKPVLAAIAFGPAAHRWYVSDLPPLASSGVLTQRYWFDAPAIGWIGAVLAGVALAAAIGARRGKQ